MIARPRKRPALGLALVALFAVAGWWWHPTLALAQSDAAPAAAPTAHGTPGTLPGEVPYNPVTGAGIDYRTLFGFSPILNSLIAALSVVALLLFIYFMLSIRTGSLAPAPLVDELTKLVIAGRFDEAANVCRSHHRVFIASIVQRCVENAGKQHSVILDMLDAEGRRRADILWNRISYLADISNVTPMLGLLGTVIGMINAFFVLPRESLSVSSRLLSASVGQAMGTTMFGLIVAIAALFFHSVVKSRTTRALADTEQIVHSIADHIKRGHQ